MEPSLVEQFRFVEADLTEMRKMFASSFQWNNDANEEFILTFEKDDQIPAKCLEIFSHIINVHELWINRITNVSDQQLNAWGSVEKIDLTLRNSNNFDVTLALLSSESYGKNFDWDFEYTNHLGAKQISKLSEAYFHILSHSSYHRGQIAYILKQNNLRSPDTNLIALKNGKY